MIERRVWAPMAQRVELIVDDDAERRAMDPAAGGWWQGAWADLDEAAAYRFSLDGGPPLPDPRARRLPHGVHGPSADVDHGAYRWADAGWQTPPFEDAVVYELHVGTFSPEGTFDGAIARLDQLVDLGITHVELMPVASFPGAHGWGYDGVGLYAVHEPYGGPGGLKRFVDAAHGRGLAVLLDVVYNHLGPDGNYLPRFGPYLTARHVTPWGAAINLDDAGSHEVRRYLCDNAVAWLRDYHLDGLRIDAVHELMDRSAFHFLEQLAVEVSAEAERLGRPLTLVAESDLNDPRLVRPVERGGYGLAAAWSDDFHHALHTALTDERSGYYFDFDGVPDVVAAIRRSFVYDGRFSPARQRNHGRPADDVPASRFVAFTQNHDQVGNRALGERLGQLVDDDAARAAAALLLTSAFVPLLFQGEEWNASTPFQYFTDHQDAALGAAVRDGRRREFEAFGWEPDAVPDPQDVATFERSRLDWAERDRSPHREMLDWYRSLIRLRRSTPGLRDGLRPTVAWEPGSSAFLVERAGVTVAANLGRHPAAVALRRGETRILLASRDAGAVDERGLVVLPAMTVAVLAADDGPRLTLPNALTYGDRT